MVNGILRTFTVGVRTVLGIWKKWQLFLCRNFIIRSTMWRKPLAPKAPQITEASNDWNSSLIILLCKTWWCPLKRCCHSTLASVMRIDGCGYSTQWMRFNAVLWLWSLFPFMLYSFVADDLENRKEGTPFGNVNNRNKPPQLCQLFGSFMSMERSHSLIRLIRINLFM